MIIGDDECDPGAFRNLHHPLGPGFELGEAVWHGDLGRGAHAVTRSPCRQVWQTWHGHLGRDENHLTRRAHKRAGLSCRRGSALAGRAMAELTVTLLAMEDPAKLDHAHVSVDKEQPVVTDPKSKFFPLALQCVGIAGAASRSDGGQRGRALRWAYRGRGHQLWPLPST
jgi:hypothetical protein